MSDRIDARALKEATERLGATFVTKDVSEQRELQAAHPSDAKIPRWHQLVGTAISKNRGFLGVDSIGHGKRGERWQKVVSAKVVTPTCPAPIASTPMASGPVAIRSFAPAVPARELGPQYADDPAFTATIRLHQSWWRAEVLQVPCGIGPQASSTTRYGNMLEAAEAEAGKNFLSDEIFAVVKARLATRGGTIEPFRLLRNLLTSQAMCFNLFGPLVANAERATRLARALLGADEVARVVRVAIEWAPEPPSEYLGDRTAFDAVIDYLRPNGELVLLGVETKLTDSFSQQEYDGDRYRRWMGSAGSPFRTEAASVLATSRFNQIWRNHLLAIAIRDHARSRYDAVRSVVIHHPTDASAREVLQSYRQHLVSQDSTFGVWTLDQVVRAFATASVGTESIWLADFERRYVDVRASEALRRR